MRIAVLDLTNQPSPLLDDVPSVGETIVEWLSPELPEAAFASVGVAYGADLPEPSDHDGFIISGSEFGVYDSTPWMAPLREFLLAARDAQRPIFGICFGHQIMADTFGGRAEKASCGNVVGRRIYRVGEVDHPTHVWHQDQVTQIPPDAKVTGTADYCPVGVLEYEFPGFSVQFHPEYTRSRLEQLFALGRDRFISAEAVDAALASFREGDVDSALFASDTASFFRRHVAVDEQRQNTQENSGIWRCNSKWNSG